MSQSAESNVDLLNEAVALRARVAEYERLEAERRRAADASRLLAEISSLFLTGKDFEKAMDAVLALCGKFLGGDRVGVFRIGDEGRRIRATHEWCGEGVGRRMQLLQEIDGSRFAWTLDRYRQGRAVVVDDVRTLPPDFRAILERERVQSLVGFPIFLGGALDSFVVVQSIGRHRSWSQADLSILRQVCELVGEGSERKGNEEAMRETLREVDEIRRQHDAVLRSTPHGMCLLTSNWRILWRNRSLLRIFSTDGGTELDLKGAPFAILFFSKEEFEEYARQALTAVRRGGSDLREVRLKRIDGSPVHVEISLVRHDPTQTAGGFVATITDVTERRKAEEGVRDSEKRFRSLVQNAMDMIFLVERDARVLYANPAVERHLGYPPEAIVGKNILDLIDPDDLPRATAAFDESLANPMKGVHASLKVRHGTSGVREIEGVATNMLGDPSVGAVVVNSRDITESAGAARSLRESEVLYESLVEGLVQNVFRKDPEGRFVYANRRFCETVGRSREELIGLTDHDLFPPALADKYRADDMAILADGKAREFVEEYVAPDGRHRHVQVVKTPVLGPEGRPVGLQGIFWDVTDKLEAEARVRESEERYRAFVDKLPLGVYRVGAGAEGRFEAVNPAMVRMFGYASPEEMLSASPADLYADEAEKDRFRRELNEKGSVADLEMRLKRRDGSSLWVTNTTVASKGPDGRVLHYDGIIRDVSDRKNAELRLRQSEERYKDVLDNITDAVYEVDRGGNLVYWNPALERLLGYSTEELTGKNNREYMDEENQRRVFEAFNHVFRTRQAHQGFEYALVTKDGERRLVEGSIAPVVDGEGRVRGFRGMMRDVTERRAAEEELATKSRELERLNKNLLRKNQELDEFTYIASHDLQEPLRKLVAFSEFLRKDVGEGLNAKAEKDLKFIVEAAQRMQTLVQDLLQLSRAGKAAMKREKIPLDDCLNRALDALAVRVESTGAEIRRDALPEVWGDRTMLTQLFQNLVGNALKFVEPGRKPVVAVSASSLGEGWQIAVEDNGIGIKAEYAEQIFSPFKRLHGRDKYEGSGIGLSICRKCVERHGGAIRVESEPGVGSKFVFTLGERRVERDEEDGNGK